MKCYLFRVIFLMVCLATLSFAQDKTTVAILDLEAKGVSDMEAGTISDRIRSEMFQTGKFTVLERSNMEEVLKEVGFQLSGCTTSECMVRAGQILGVKRMVGGSVSRLGALYSISLRLIDVETSRVVSVGTADCNGCPIEQVAVKSVREAVGKLVGAAPSSGQAVQEERTTADLYLTSEPQGAEIFIDGEKLADTVTPAIIEGLEKGEHQVKLVSGYYEARQSVFLDPGDIKRVSLTLELQAGEVKIISNPFEAEVFLGGEFKGKTPVIIPVVLAGKAEITLKKKGYKDFVTSIQVEPKTTNRFDFTLTNIPLKQTPKKSPAKEKPEQITQDEGGSNTWLWVGIGVVAVGVAAGVALSADKVDDGGGSGQGAIVVTIPQNP